MPHEMRETPQKHAHAGTDAAPVTLHGVAAPAIYIVVQVCMPAHDASARIHAPMHTLAFTESLSSLALPVSRP